MKIAVFSDIHGNKQALDAIIEATKEYDRIIFLGDAIGMGPQPRECIETILNSNIEYIIGNHEQYLIEGYKKFENIGFLEYAHHKWVKEETKVFIPKLRKLKKQITINKILLIHYAYQNNRYKRPNDHPDIDYLNNTFSNYNNEKIIYGHSHEINSLGRYYCLGSSGCRKDNTTFFTEIDENYNLKRIYLKYDRDKFENILKLTDYPLKKNLSEIFFGIKE